ncbi:MAG: hypothetical protein M0P12_00195 [Paludibacteraceae bacterium]|nr:hypothetical protein [Paludibacteraceae bacterium]MCK9615569.1 hypothetical protein [Candidatus Omnitrophota bacterium]
MKIDRFPTAEEGFKLTPCVFAGVDCVLVGPLDIKTKFNEGNKIFRSSIWTLDGDPVSLGFRKFTNYGEAPAFEPFDINDPSMTAVQKIDGSCLLVSKFRGQLIVRTRGTIDARQMKNGQEIDELIAKYPDAFDNAWLDNGYSICYEWTTPSNIIVLSETETPQLWLTAIINHEDYSYLPQMILDIEAKRFGVNRPKTYRFESFSDLVNAVEAFRGIEGVVVYTREGQILKKVKSISYLALHRMKSHLGSTENVVDYFIANGCKTAEDLIKKVTEDSDYEIAKVVSLSASMVEEAYRRTVEQLDAAYSFVEQNVKCLTNRKEMAKEILGHNKKLSGFMFQMLDGKIKQPWNDIVLKKIMMENVK